jgi:hypothetical protein
LIISFFSVVARELATAATQAKVLFKFAFLNMSFNTSLLNLSVVARELATAATQAKVLFKFALA